MFPTEMGKVPLSWMISLAHFPVVISPNIQWCPAAIWDQGIGHEQSQCFSWTSQGINGSQPSVQAVNHLWSGITGVTSWKQCFFFSDDEVTPLGPDQMALCLNEWWWIVILTFYDHLTYSMSAITGCKQGIRFFDSHGSLRTATTRVYIFNR